MARLTAGLGGGNACCPLGACATPCKACSFVSCPTCLMHALVHIRKDLRAATERSVLHAGHGCAAYYGWCSGRGRLCGGRVRADRDGAAPGAERTHPPGADRQQDGPLLPGADAGC
eukprot:354654-Chlamydomonas_euryale.AAC.13